jgi:hypothetical protein
MTIICDIPFEECKRCKHFKECDSEKLFIRPCKKFEPIKLWKARIALTVMSIVFALSGFAYHYLYKLPWYTVCCYASFWLAGYSCGALVIITAKMKKSVEKSGRR